VQRETYPRLFVNFRQSPQYSLDIFANHAIIGSYLPPVELGSTRRLF